MATFRFFFGGSNFMARMKAAKHRQMPLDSISGHSPLAMPKASHSAKPATVSRYMPREISCVLAERMIFHA